MHSAFICDSNSFYIIFLLSLDSIRSFIGIELRSMLIEWVSLPLNCRPIDVLHAILKKLSLSIIRPCCGVIKPISFSPVFSPSIVAIIKLSAPLFQCLCLRSFLSCTLSSNPYSSTPSLTHAVLQIRSILRHTLTPHLKCSFSSLLLHLQCPDF